MLLNEDNYGNLCMVSCKTITLLLNLCFQLYHPHYANSLYVFFNFSIMTTRAKFLIERHDSGKFKDTERGIELHYELYGTGPQKVLFVMGVCQI